MMIWPYRINPKLAEAYKNRGGVKGKLNDYRGAIEDCNKAIEINPKFPGAYFDRGIAEILLGQKDSGCLDLSKAGELGLVDSYALIKKYCK